MVDSNKILNACVTLGLLFLTKDADESVYAWPFYPSRTSDGFWLPEDDDNAYITLPSFQQFSDRLPFDRAIRVSSLISPDPKVSNCRFSEEYEEANAVNPKPMWYCNLKRVWILSPLDCPCRAYESRITKNE